MKFAKALAALVAVIILLAPPQAEAFTLSDAHSQAEFADGGCLLCLAFGAVIFQSEQGISEPRSNRETGGSMARKRYQQGGLRVEGKKCPVWVLRWREDVIDPTGRLIRPERRQVLGTLKAIPTKRLARRAAEQVIARINSLDYRPGRAATVAEFAAIYKAEAIPLMKPSAQASTRSILKKHIVPRFGAINLSDMNSRAIQRAVTDLHKAEFARKTIRNIVATLSALQTSAKKYGYLTTRVGADEITLPAHDFKREEPHFTPEQAISIIDGASSVKWACLFMISARMGLRIGEALGLTWAAIDLDTGIMRITQSAVFGKIQTVKSRASRRDLPIPDDLIDRLRPYRAEWVPNDSGLLFATSEGNPYWADTVRARVMTPLRKRLGIDRGAFHAFRHGHATNLFASGANPRAVQDLMGHADMATTMRYTHSVNAEMRKAVSNAAPLFLRQTCGEVGSRLQLVKG